MADTALPGLRELADDDDQLDWSVARDGRMADYATDDEPDTEPAAEVETRGAQAFQLDLPTALRRRGLTVEVVPGWETRGSAAFNPGGSVSHWTAGSRGTLKRPSLNVCVNGRPGIPGPLCNVYLDRRGVAVVVAAGRANHAGTGSWMGMVGNSAVWGTEAEAADGNDWTDAQRWAYPRINAAYADLSGFGAGRCCGHSEWAGPRKQDINGWPMSSMRAQVHALLTGATPTTPAPEDDDVALTPAQAQALADIPEIKRLVGVLAGWSGAATAFEVAAQNGPADAAEARRMLGVLLGWTPPASDNEATSLAKLWDATPDEVTVVIDPATIAAAIPDTIARDVADLLAARLQD